MTLEQIREVISKLQPGQKVQVVFKPESLFSLVTLPNAYRSGLGTVSLAQLDVAIIWIALQDGNWDNHPTRAFTLTLKSGWKPDTFQKKLAPALEFITVL